jgi:hypothetical protein
MVSPCIAVQSLPLSIKGKFTTSDYLEACKTMTEKPDSDESTSPEKLLIDNPSDFQFHVAYLAYSNAYDKTDDIETKKQLNQNISALQKNEIDYPTFYRNISQYRKEETSQHDYGRTLIRTQKKREWRRKTQKHERIERHRR